MRVNATTPNSLELPKKTPCSLLGRIGALALCILWMTGDTFLTLTQRSHSQREETFRDPFLASPVPLPPSFVPPAEPASYLTQPNTLFLHEIVSTLRIDDPAANSGLISDPSDIRARVERLSLPDLNAIVSRLGTVNRNAQLPSEKVAQDDRSRRFRGNSFKHLLNRLISNLSISQIQGLDYQLLDYESLAPQTVKLLFPYPQAAPEDSLAALRNKEKIRQETDNRRRLVPQEFRDRVATLLIG